MEDPTKTAKIWSTLMRKIWDDPNLKDQLKTDPHQVLKEYGLSISTDQAIKIHENSVDTLHFIIPEKPQKDLSDEMLFQIVAGK